MVDFRIYRAALLPALVALVIVLFSLEGPPSELDASGTPIDFDERTAAQTAREIARTAPARFPGSADDRAIARMVKGQFAAIRAGETSEHAYGSSFDGEDVVLSNVLLTLPGDSDRIVAVIAARDTVRAPGAASTASATAALLELARTLGSSTHAKTLVFASTDGGTDGATGARELLDQLPDPSLIDAVVVISQPGASIGGGPSIVSTSATDRSASIQLVQTAERGLEAQAEVEPADASMWQELARLAFPSGLGEQAALIAEDVDAVAVSGAAERPLGPAQDQLEDISPDTLGQTGRTALATVLALDASPAPPEHGPTAYVFIGNSIVPGWALALLAVVLLLPAAAAAADGTARAVRSGHSPGRALPWVGRLALAPLAALLLLYVLALIGVMDRPRYPFDPGRFEVGLLETLTMILFATVALRIWYSTTAWRTPDAVDRGAAIPVSGAVAVLAIALIWLVNPYLALLLVPLGHAWLVCARKEPPAGLMVVLGALAIALLPALAAYLQVADDLDLGMGAPWQFMLMLGDGQVPPPVAFGICGLIGSGLALVLVSGGGWALTRQKPLDASPISAGMPEDDEKTGDSPAMGRKGSGRDDDSAPHRRETGVRSATGNDRVHGS